MPFTCPYCNYSKSWSLRRNKRKCKKCRREYSPQKYFVPQLRLREEHWRRCIQIFLEQRTIAALKVGGGIGHNTAVKVANILRACMLSDFPSRFTGPCEMDETYIGGQRKNKKLHIRRIRAKRGHGTDKLPIMGIYGRQAGQVYVEVIPKLNIKRIIEIIQERVEKGSPIYTDAYKMYRCLPRHGYPHQYVDHDYGEYVRGMVHTNNIDGFWGILKRKLGCIGGMRRDRLHLFMAEIAWKFNQRNKTQESQQERLMGLLLKAQFGGRK